MVVLPTPPFELATTRIEPLSAKASNSPKGSRGLLSRREQDGQGFYAREACVSCGNGTAHMPVNINVASDSPLLHLKLGRRRAHLFPRLDACTHLERVKINLLQHGNYTVSICRNFNQ